MATVQCATTFLNNISNRADFILNYRKYNALIFQFIVISLISISKWCWISI